MSDHYPPFTVKVFENSACERQYIGGPDRPTDHIVFGTLLYKIRVTWHPGGMALFAKRLGELRSQWRQD